MNRRDLLKSAIALPLLGFVPKAEASLNIKVEITKEKALESWILGKCEELNIHPADWQLTQLIRMFSENQFIEIEAGNSTRQFCGCSVGVGKSYLLAMYSMIIASLNERITICIVSQNLAKAREITNLCTGIATLRTNTRLFSIAINDADYIRGLRPSILLVDDYSKIDKKLLNDKILPGLLAVHSDPISGKRSGKIVFCG